MVNSVIRFCSKGVAADDIIPNIMYQGCLRMKAMEQNHIVFNKYRPLMNRIRQIAMQKNTNRFGSWKVSSSFVATKINSIKKSVWIVLALMIAFPATFAQKEPGVLERRVDTCGLDRYISIAEDLQAGKKVSDLFLTLHFINV